MKHRVALVITALLLPGRVAWAQRPARPIPPPITVPRDFQRAIERGTRTATGEPGARYWQQHARYRIEAFLYPEAKLLEGREEIVYFNRSPDTLRTLYFHLHQNLHAPGAVRNEPQEVTGGVELKAVSADGTPLAPARGSATGYAVEGTILRLQPPKPVLPGDSARFYFAWSFHVPQSGAGRMGSSGDNLFFIAYWYPRVAVYDDVVGWQRDPYLGQAEFYDGFGDYTLSIEAPEGWIVLATGELENEEETLAPFVRERLRLAERSDTVVTVLDFADLASRRATLEGPNGRLVWRYTARNVRDVAFSATRASRWDAVRTPVGDRDGDGKTDYARVDALYREQATLWTQAARYARHAISHHSRFTGLSFPWSHMTAVEGAGIIGGGMEFPMMTLIGDYRGRSDSALYYVIAHELAHMWVPMIVGTDERRYGWMDEGTTTFNENRARAEFYPGSDPDGADLESYIRAARSGYESELMRWTDYLYPGQNGIASYAKPATLLVALRALLGDTLFDRAYRLYFRRWAFKHPYPWDFFNTFNHATGRNLDWFWRTWYYETWTLDQAIAAVRREGSETVIVVEDRGWAAMPARLAITLENGQVLRREVPVEHWLQGHRSAELRLPASPAVVRVEIDPERAFPDIDRQNNTWRR
jgi:hypothetical protein